MKCTEKEVLLGSRCLREEMQTKHCLNCKKKFKMKVHYVEFILGMVIPTSIGTLCNDCKKK